MADTTPRPVVSEWLVKLGLRCAPTKQAEDVELRLQTYTPALARDMPQGMFCEASLEDMARKFEHFPAYAALRKALDAWWSVNKPKQTALPSNLAESSLTTDERTNVLVWLNAEAAGASDIALRFAVLRRHVEPAYRWLIANNARAREIAERQEWETTTPAQDWADAGKVLASVRNILEPPHPQAKMLLGMLHALVIRHAPENAALVPLEPPDWSDLPTPGAQIEAPPLYAKPDPAHAAPSVESTHGALSPEALRAVRLANPALRAVQERQDQRAALATPPPPPLPPLLTEVDRP